MKVLHVLKSKIYSGAEHVVCESIHAMPDDVECRYFSADGPIRDRLVAEGIDYDLVDQVTVSSIRREIASFQPDVIHAHDFSASLMVSIAAPKGVRVISHLHNNATWLPKMDPRGIVYRMASKRFDAILLVSSSILTEYRYRSAIEDKAKVLQNPFSVEEVQKKAATTCDSKMCPAPDDTCDLIYVGRLEPEKNPLGFLNIVAECNSLDLSQPHSHDISAWMIGDGSLRSSCQQIIQDKSLPVQLLGFQENPYCYMKRARIICIPSIFEGFGLVALEAMCLGIPVLCSGAGGLSDIVDETCGKVCKSEAEYVTEIQKLLSDSAYYEAKSSAAEERAKAFDNIASYGKELYGVYLGH